MELLGDMGHVKSHYGLFGDGVQDSCTVGAKRTIGLENRFGHNDGSPTRRGSSGCSFRSVWRWC